MCLDKNTTRIKYDINKFDNFITEVNSINKHFDLILVDPHHEYKYSITTFKILTSLLNDNCILISHDCYPRKFNITSPFYIPGEWCGVTYAAFIENSYNNPNFYYAVIDNDYGLGIISKTEIQFVKKINNEKQEIFLNLFKNNKYKKAYEYLTHNSNDIINLIGE